MEEQVMYEETANATEVSSTEKVEYLSKTQFDGKEVRSLTVSTPTGLKVYPLHETVKDD